MKKQTLYGVLESILFAMGTPVEIDKLSEVLLEDFGDVKNDINEFVDIFNKENRGLKIVRLDRSIQMVSRSEHHSYIAKMLETKSQKGLSQSALEALSVIAYNQPVTKAMVDAVRGVDSYNSIVRLLERELIEQRGRLDAPGRPMLYGTTSEFLRVFGLESLDELPKLERKLMDSIGHTDNLTFSDLEQEPTEESDL
ncbi:MAG: SMC-Scp complex subunit ScpB [Clostridia bacterium]|nr:SMC-Scp complex subunit ScpB [Clostridia bacterium]